MNNAIYIMTNCSLFPLHLTIYKLTSSKDWGVIHGGTSNGKTIAGSWGFFWFLNIMPPSVFKILMLRYSFDRSKPLCRVVRAMSSCNYSVLSLPPFTSTFILLLNFCLWHPVVPSLLSDLFYLRDECYCFIHSWKCVLHYHSIYPYNDFLITACRLKVWYSMLHPSDLHFYIFCCFFPVQLLLLRVCGEGWSWLLACLSVAESTVPMIP